MTLFITNDADTVRGCVRSALEGRDQLAFVCENADEPVLIIFAEHCQRYNLADILRSTAEQLSQAIPNYDRNL